MTNDEGRKTNSGRSLREAFGIPHSLVFVVRRSSFVVDAHIRATCSDEGSAQQYQGSFRYGTVARAGSGGGGSDIPAASTASFHAARNSSLRG
jgi:hypothetical protein